MFELQRNLKQEETLRKKKEKEEKIEEVIERNQQMEEQRKFEFLEHARIADERKRKLD